jgi:hypothetical protein
LYKASCNCNKHVTGNTVHETKSEQVERNVRVPASKTHHLAPL